MCAGAREPPQQSSMAALGLDNRHPLHTHTHPPPRPTCSTVPSGTSSLASRAMASWTSGSKGAPTFWGGAVGPVWCGRDGWGGVGCVWLRCRKWSLATRP